MPNPSGATVKYGLPYLNQNDVPDVATASQLLAQGTENIIASAYQGTLASRPAPGVSGRFYWATDTGGLSYDNGTLWTPLGSFTPSSVTTLTNKRYTRRVVGIPQAAVPVINTDNMDVAVITGLAQAITSFTTSLTGTPVDGDMLLIRITDNGTARAIAWGAKFEASTVALPTTTVVSTMLTVGFEWNIVTSAWRCVGVA
jgi:hypothetical protein